MNLKKYPGLCAPKNRTVLKKKYRDKKIVSILYISISSY